MAAKDKLQSLYECGFRRGERLSVLSDDTNFFSVDARELQSFPKEAEFFILVVRREGVLMDNYYVLVSTTRISEVRQQALFEGI
jgi:hypothetical protein